MTPLAERTTDNENFEFDALKYAVNYRQAVFNEFAPFLNGEILEVGAGIGQMTELLQRYRPSTRLRCIEPSVEFCTEHRAKFPNVELVCGTIDDLPSGTSGDAIVSINVLEHIEDDAHELGAYFDKLSRRRGHLCLLVPARPEIYSSIDRRFGHYRRYTRRQLQTNLLAAGFTLKRLFYFNWLGYLAWGIKFRLLNQQRFGSAQVHFFDSALFPIVSWLEKKIFRPPVGQSLIAVAVAGEEARSVD
jgi:2-polyprenyl-3-methyl-5-hydroxy-6-metoxy-1,4-benzoquinol methylase